MLRNVSLTRAAGMGPLPDILEEAGQFGTVTKVFSMAGLPTLLINERHHWVPLSFLADLFRLGAKVIDDPLLGLRVGEHMAPEEYGVWALYGLRAMTLRDMIARLEHTLSIHSKGVRLTLSPRASGLVAWEYTHQWVSSPRFIQHSDHIIPVMLKSLQRFIGNDLEAVEIEVPYKCSLKKMAAVREDRTSLPWSFGRHGVAVVFPEQMLTLQSSPPEMPGCPSNLAEQVEVLLQRSRSEVNDVALFVEVIMLLRLMDQRSDIDGLADILGLSTRSLQRELAALSLTYRRMLSKIRMQRAQELIETTDNSLTEIALELGYKDSAHFTRGFKQYFGHPPSHSRNKLKS
jgi:AraC-like DNA-binding protein